MIKMKRPSSWGPKGSGVKSVSNSENNIPSEPTQVNHRLTMLDFSVFQTFVNPGEVVEVRILDGKKVNSGYFDNSAAFCESVKLADKKPHDVIYFTLQVIDPRLLGRACNRIKDFAGLTTADHDGIAYRWLPVDLDPVRPKGISSSDSELAEAMRLREEVSQWIISELKFSPPIKAMSGNGAHLLFRLPDLPANKENKSFIQNILKGLARQFNTDKVEIDQTVFNPAQIWKLYGTTARKGDPVPAGPYREARPHRMAYIDDMGGLA